MELATLVTVLALAFLCEFVDSTLGMGYGTIMTPGLFILGFEAETIVPAILLSQALAGIPATMFHRYHGNLKFGKDERYLKGGIYLVIVGGVAISLAVLLSVRLPEAGKDIYLALLLIGLGILLMARKRRPFSSVVMHLMALFAVFNKAVTGAGFGPVLTSGQIVSGKEARHAVGHTTALEVPICLFAYIAYVVAHGPTDLELPLVLTAGALVATPIGPWRAKTLVGPGGRMAVGVLSFFLGLFILLWLLLRPYLGEVVGNPFFWAVVSMLALLGCTATLMTRRLGRYLALNGACVGVFALGRFLIPIACCEQPQFALGLTQTVLGGGLFFLGLVFMSAIMYINPWPVTDKRYSLHTSGLYSVVRHPMYLGELLWTLGWSLAYGSILGVALVPVWWGALLFHSIIEEEQLERRFGQRYTDYMERTPGRIVPGLPI